MTGRQACNMIKGNESDVENIDLELHAMKGGKFLCLHCFELQMTAPISATRCPIGMGFESK